jgi:predicted alpha/beta-hydrolase family hydrolase
LRDAHLPQVEAPMLFVQGTRDAFARWDLLTATVARLGAKATLFVVEGADHSFRVPRKQAPAPSAVEAAIGGRILAWLDGLAL